MTTWLARLKPWRPGVVEPPFELGVSEYERKRFTRAAAAWLEAASEGNLEAEYRLGECYAKGEGVLRSMADAVVVVSARG